MKKINLLVLLVFLISAVSFAISLDYSKDYIFQNDDFILRVSITEMVAGSGDMLKLDFIPRKGFRFVPFMSTFTDNFGNDSALIVKDHSDFLMNLKPIFNAEDIYVIPITHLLIDFELIPSIKFLTIDPTVSKRKLKIAYIVDEELKFFETTIELATK